MVACGHTARPGLTPDPRALCTALCSWVGTLVTLRAVPGRFKRLSDCGRRQVDALCILVIYALFYIDLCKFLKSNHIDIWGYYLSFNWNNQKGSELLVTNRVLIQFFAHFFSLIILHYMISTENAQRHLCPIFANIFNKHYYYYQA